MEAVVNEKSQPLLGEMLKDEGLVSHESLQKALEHQGNTKDALGQVLTHLGIVKPLALTRILARQQQKPFADLVAEPPEHALLHTDQIPAYIHHRLLPWKREGDTVWVAMVQESPAAIAYAKTLFGDYVHIALTTSYDMTHALEKSCGAVLDDHARNHLFNLDRLASARAEQRPLPLVVLASIVVILWFCLHPDVMPWIVGVADLLFIATIGMKCLLFLAAYGMPRITTPKDGLKALEEATLPVFTILVPLYKEAESIPRLVQALKRLDYPATRLDIKLIVEEDDANTLAAIHREAPPACFEIIRVPYSEPRTKPKACNFALQFARGEFITIYDAEDAPEPQQLKKAVYQFRTCSHDVVCLQARLNYYNRRENLLTALFSLEYATLFDFLIPGLYRLRLPIPLGGTSNHFRTHILRQIGEWDPYNVTEDADLGIRLASKGYKTLPLDSLTLEEAPITLWAWMKQRTRWIKGYMITWLVAMRRPVQLFRTLGPWGFLGFQLFIGGASFVYLITPILWTMMVLWVTGIVDAAYMPPAWVQMACLGVLGAGVAVQWAIACWVASMRLWWDEWLALLLFPLYWLLHSIACYRALWQLLTAPFYWEKTSHGLTRMVPGRFEAVDFA